MQSSTPGTDKKSFEDLRESRRASLMLRSAKVICHTGEYVTIVRDVSEMGVGLSFLHKAPPEPRIILELANGATYPIERVWAGKSRAGYRFASQIDLEEFIHEDSPFNVRPVRLRATGNGHVFDGKTNLPIKLRDLSREGASFESEATLPRTDSISLTVAGINQRTGRICWNNDIVYGVEFQSALTNEELALAALKLHPFEEQDMGGRGPRLSASRVA